MPNPFIEYGNQETSPLLGLDRAIRYGCPLLVWSDCSFAETLDHRNKLHPARTRLVTQETVDVERSVGICTIDGDLEVVFDFMLLQQP